MEAPEREFNALYDAHADAIFRHLYFRLGSRERALELTQEVFARFWEYLRSGKTVEHPRAFLYRSAHNAFVNEIRKPPAPVSLDALAENGYEAKFEEADRAELERQAEVVAALQSIDGESRDALIMRYIDGMAVKEIAQALGEKENTISVRIRRGLEKLKERYGTE